MSQSAVSEKLGYDEALSDSTTRTDRGEFLEQRDIVRSQCLSLVRTATHGKILSSADVQAYEEQVLSESALELSGYLSHGEKLTALRGMLHEWIPKIIDDAKVLENEFERLLGDARATGGISDTSLRNWEQRFRDENVIYYKKKEFIQKRFPGYVENWKKLGDDVKSIDTLQKKLGLGDDALPELKAIRASGFMDSHFLFKRDRASAALAALSAYEKGEYAPGKPDPGLFAEAKGKLQKAAAEGAISEWKVGRWLKTIFEKHHATGEVAEFVRGKGERTLSALIGNWKDVRGKFDEVERKRMTKGPPRGFHFVRLDVFLHWNYERRRSYVEEADSRFQETNIGKERESFLRIRHALDTRDFEEAATFMRLAKQEVLSGPERARLASMEIFLRDHGGKGSESANQKSPLDMNTKLQALLDNHVPAELRGLYLDCMHRGYNPFWVLTTLLYNRDWCHAHHFLSPEKERMLSENAKTTTEIRIRDGHGRGHEANDLRGKNNQLPAIRDQTDKNSAQVLFTDRSSKDRIVTAIAEQGSSKQFWYWTSLIPEGISIAKHRELTQPGGINFRMKRLLRSLDAAGYRFSENGFPEPKNSNTR